MAISLSSLGGGKPTPDAWGTRTLTLSGDLVLTDSDEAIQSLTTSVDRNVDLPVITADTPIFTIINNVASVGLLSLRNTGDDVILNIGPGKVASVWTDGVTAYASIVGEADVEASTAKSVYMFGVNFATNHYGGVSNVAGSSGLSQLGNTLVPEAGDVTDISISASLTNVGIQLWKNEALSSTLTNTASNQETQSITPVAVAKGDRIATFQDASAAARSSIYVHVTNTSIAPTSLFTYGGSPTLAGSQRFIGANHTPSNGVSTAPIVRNGHLIDSDGILRTFTWHVTTTGADFPIYVNGQIVTTINTSTQIGTGAIDVPVFAGDILRIGHETAVTGISNFQVSIESARTSVQFGGVAAFGNFFLPGRSAVQTAIPTSSEQSRYVVPVASTLVALAIAVSDVTINYQQAFVVSKNGVQEAAVQLRNRSIGVMSLGKSVDFDAGDYLEISCGGTGTGNCSVRAVFE